MCVLWNGTRRRITMGYDEQESMAFGWNSKKVCLLHYVVCILLVLLLLFPSQRLSFHPESGWMDGPAGHCHWSCADSFHCPRLWLSLSLYVQVILFVSETRSRERDHSSGNSSSCCRCHVLTHSLTHCAKEQMDPSQSSSMRCVKSLAAAMRCRFL